MPDSPKRAVFRWPCAGTCQGCSPRLQRGRKGAQQARTMKAAAAIVGVFFVAWLCFQRHTISQLRAETGLLTQNQAEGELPMRGATQIATNADSAAEIAKLKEETRDLPKLRNE